MPPEARDVRLAEPDEHAGFVLRPAVDDCANVARELEAEVLGEGHNANLHWGPSRRGTAWLRGELRYPVTQRNAEGR